MPDYAPLCSLDLLLSEFKDVFNFSISKQLRALSLLNLALRLIIDNYFLTELSYNIRDGNFLKQE